MQTLTSSYIRSLFIPRRKDSHKGDYGHVLVVAGSAGMMGAASLCVHGALRAGSGLVTLAVPERLYSVAANYLRPEAMALLMPGAKGYLDTGGYETLHEFIEKRRITSLILGPGLGRNAGTVRLVKKLLAYEDLPVIIDADAINALSGTVRKGYKVPELLRSRAGILITPHPGELGRLLGLPAAEIQKDRAGIAAEFARQNGIVCLLKGNGTIITDGKKVFLNPTGNPGMATGGTGDVLSGMLGALVAQVKDNNLLNAGCAGAFLHGLAGDLEMAEKTGVSLLAGDIAEAIPRAIKKLKD